MQNEKNDVRAKNIQKRKENVTFVFCGNNITIQMAVRRHVQHEAISIVVDF